MDMFEYAERQRSTAAQADEFVGLNDLARALCRCAQCAGRSDCGPRAPFCPNGSLLLRAKVLGGVRS